MVIGCSSGIKLLFIKAASNFRAVGGSKIL